MLQNARSGGRVTMETKHTPGPWTAVKRGAYVYLSGGTFDRHSPTTLWEDFASVVVEVEEQPDEVGEANARLITATLELLDVARDFEDLLTSYELNHIDGSEIADAELKKIRAVIAKATGKEA